MLAEHDLDTPQARVDADELDAIVASLRNVGAVGHRIVHGGQRFQRPVR